jgi:hypothetical protein
MRLLVGPTLGLLAGLLLVQPAQAVFVLSPSDLIIAIDTGGKQQSSRWRAPVGSARR